MKNICLFDTAVGSLNLGDEIIFDSVKAGLSPILSDASVFRLGTHVENFSAVQMMKPNAKIDFFTKSMNYKFICGTSLLVPTFKTLQKQFALSKSSIPLYKDCILVGVGKNKAYDELDSSAVKLYKSIFSTKYKHSVRDEEAKKVVEGLGFEVLNTGCPTLWGMTEEKCAAIPKKKSENVIFSVSGQEKYHDAAADTKMIECLKKNYSKMHVWIQTIRDENYLRSLINPEEVGIKLIYSLEQYAALLDGGNVDYIGTRLHGGIFSLQHGCRTLIVQIDHRAEGFHKSNNIPIIKRSEIEQLDDVINHDILTEIKLDNNAIEEFIGQFI